MTRRERKELLEIMDDYGYIEPDIYQKDLCILFIDSTSLQGYPIEFDPDKREFSVSVEDDDEAGAYEYEEDEWEEGTSQLQIDGYEAVRLARDLSRRKNAKN